MTNPKNNAASNGEKKTKIEQLNLIYKLNGNFDNGINVFELSPILLSIGNLISESQKTIFPNSQKLGINVRPFKQNSFDIQLILHPIANLQQVLEFIKSPQGKDIKELLEYIGLLSPYIVTSSVSLIKLIKWLKGKPKSVDKLKSKKYKYTGNDGKSIEVEHKVHALFQNVVIQQNIYNGIAKPFEDKRVKNIECYVKDEDKTKEIIEKDIVEPCKNYMLAEIPSAEKVSENSNNRKLWVHPKRISCEGESNTWSFRIAGSDEILRVTSIKDPTFLENVKSNRFRLSHTDKLHVEIQESQSVQGHKEVMLCEISKVIEYVKSDEQISLELPKGEEIN